MGYPDWMSAEDIRQFEVENEGVSQADILADINKQQGDTAHESGASAPDEGAEHMGNGDSGRNSGPAPVLHQELLGRPSPQSASLPVPLPLDGKQREIVRKLSCDFLNICGLEPESDGSTERVFSDFASTLLWAKRQQFASHVDRITAETVRQTERADSAVQALDKQKAELERLRNAVNTQSANREQIGELEEKIKLLSSKVTNAEAQVQCEQNAKILAEKKVRDCS